MNKVPNRVYHIISNKNVTILSSYVNKLNHYYYCKIPNKKKKHLCQIRMKMSQQMATTTYRGYTGYIYICIEMNLIKFIKTNV